MFQEHARCAIGIFIIGYVISGVTTDKKTKIQPEVCPRCVLCDTLIKQHTSDNIKHEMTNIFAQD